MSGVATELSFMSVADRSYVSLDPLLLRLWERYAGHLDAGREVEGDETRAIIDELMDAKP